jgi:hypothetical protein
VIVSFAGLFGRFVGRSGVLFIKGVSQQSAV